MKSFLMLTVLALAVAVSLSAAETFVQKTCSMKVDGTSTLHDWTSTVNTVRAKGDVTMQDGNLTAVNTMWVQADVKSIRSEKGSDMDDKIYEALKSNKNPTITFNLTSVRNIRQEGNLWVVDAVGDLIIAGTKKQVPLTVKATVLAGGELKFTGSKSVKMTEFNMERPSAMLGMIKAGDEVTITFELTLKRG
jgi:opacity protein-like surface antigen